MSKYLFIELRYQLIEIVKPIRNDHSAPKDMSRWIYMYAPYHANPGVVFPLADPRYSGPRYFLETAPADPAG
jgi:hypothetical protein